MGSATHSSSLENDIRSGDIPQNVESMNDGVLSNDRPTNTHFSLANESIVSDSGDGVPSPEALVSRGAGQRKVLVNRVTYFSFILALCAPIANFFLTYKAMNLGITLGMMVWTLLGILWCGGFTMVVGPIFALVSTIVRLLDVIPALGSSLWVLLSICLSTAVINDSRGLPPLNNLPLFSLIYANGIAALTTLQFEIAHIGGNGGGLTNFSNGDNLLYSVFGYTFHGGKCGFHAGKNSIGHKFVLPLISLPDKFDQAYQQIRDNASKYLQGEDLDDFHSNFAIWQREARLLQRSLWLRRIFCLVGYVIETAALYFSFIFLNQLTGYTGKEDKQTTPEYTNLLLPIWEIGLVAIISCFSSYLWALLNAESTCTSPPEVSSVMLQRLKSRVNWSGPHSGYLANGKCLRSPWRGRSYGEILAGELPTIGIVLDDDGFETGLTVLHSTVPNCRLIVKRVGSELLRTQLMLEGEPERAGLEGENVIISEEDKIT